MSPRLMMAVGSSTLFAGSCLSLVVLDASVMLLRGWGAEDLEREAHFQFGR